MTRRSSVTSVRRPSSGWTPTSWQRRRNTTTNRRSWSPCATLSSPNCTQRLVVPVAECPGECPEECPGECPEVCPGTVGHPVLAAADLPSRRWTKPQLLLDTPYR